MKEIKIKSVLNRNIVTEFLEYVLVFLIILDMSTMFEFTERSISTGFDTVERYGPILILVCLILFNFKNENIVMYLKKLYVQGGIYVFLILFYFLNVTNTTNVTDTARQLYIFRYLIFLPLLVIYVQTEKVQNRQFALLFKFANIIFVVSIFSLFSYLFVTLGDKSMTPDLLCTQWAMFGKGTQAITNMFGFSGYEYGNQFKIGNFSFIKNYGFFPEPPMFYNALIVALYVDLFLRRGKEAFVRGIILSLTILTTGGTNGLIIMLIGWGLFYVSYKKKLVSVKNIIFLGIVVCIAIYFIYDKSNQFYGSYWIHIDDYIVSLKCFKNHVLFGAGFDNDNAIIQYMSNDRLLGNTGISNSIARNLAQNGIFFGGLFIVVFILAIGWNLNRNRNRAFFVVGPFLVYCVSSFLNRYILILVLIIGLSTIDFSDFFSIHKLDYNNCIEPEIKNKVDKSNIIKSIKEIVVLNKGFAKKVVWGVFWFFIVLLLFCNIKALPVTLNKYYTLRNLYISQSAFRLPTLGLLVVANVMLYRNKIEEGLIDNEIINRIVNIAPIIVIWIIYEASYGFVSHIVRISLNGMEKYTDAAWSISILIIYLVVTILVFELKDILLSSNRLDVKSYLWVFVYALSLSIIVVGLGAYSSKNEDRVTINEYTDELDDHTHEATVVLNLGDVKFRNNEEICTVRIVGIEDNNVLTIVHITGEDVDENGTVTKNIIYRNTSKGTDVYYDIIPESNVSFSIYASSHYDELKELYVSTYNVYNLPIRRMYFNADGTPQIKDGGYSILESDYDSKGRTLANRYYDINGNKIMYRGRFFEVKYEQDGRGNATKESYYDMDGNPARQNGGYYQLERDYNEKDLATSTRYLDANGEPVIIYDGYAEVRTDYNDIHKKSKEAYFDVEGNSVINRSGFSSIEYIYNVDKAVECQIYFGTDGEPILNKSGYAKVTYDYNDKLDLVDEKYFDVEGNPINSLKGYARTYKEFNDNHQVTHEEYRDKDDVLVGLIKTQEFDNHYNRIAVNYTDDTGTLAMVDGQYSTIKYYYDDRNRCIIEEYYNTDGELSNLTNCAAIISYDYDDNTNLKVRQSYLDSNKSPVMCNGQYYAVEYTYNDKKLVETQSYYDTDSKPVMLRDQYSSFKQHYDTFNNVLDVTYYDAHGKKTINAWGYCELRREYNNDNKVITEKYYDTDGNQMNLPSGQADKHLEYDDRGNIIREYYHDVDDRTAYIWGEYSEVRSEFDELNRLVRREYYKDNEHAVRGKGYSSYENDYDEKGNNIEERYYDVDNKLVVISDGYAIRKNRFDDRNCLIEEAYLDVNERLILTNWGFSIRRRKYDDVKRIVESSFFDETYMPITQEDGAFIRKFKYDKMGYDWTSETFYDVEDKVTCAYGSYAEIKRYYDNRKNVIREEYYDMNGNMINLADGEAYFIQEFDDRYNVTQISYYDMDNNPVDKAGEYFLDSRMYDSNGKLTMKVLYKVDGTIFLQEEY